MILPFSSSGFPSLSWRRFVFSLSPRGTSVERAGERGKP